LRILRLRLAADCRFLRANLRAFFPSFFAIAASASPRRYRSDGEKRRVGFRVWAARLFSGGFGDEWNGTLTAPAMGRTRWNVWAGPT
jgi:hypothetical protein